MKSSWETHLISVRGLTNASDFICPYALLGHSLLVGLKHWTRSKNRDHLFESSAYSCTTFSLTFPNRCQLMKKRLGTLGWLKLRAQTRSRRVKRSRHSAFRQRTEYSVQCQASIRMLCQKHGPSFNFARFTQRNVQTTTFHQRQPPPSLPLS